MAEGCPGAPVRPRFSEVQGVGRGAECGGVVCGRVCGGGGWRCGRGGTVVMVGQDGDEKGMMEKGRDRWERRKKEGIHLGHYEHSVARSFLTFCVARVNAPDFLNSLART